MSATTITPKDRRKNSLPMKGRKVKLTPEVQNRIVEMISAHHFHSTACASAGISEATFYAWIERGRKARSGQYLEFLEAVTRAEALSEVALVKGISDDDDWRAKMAILERRFPDRWRPPTREMSGPKGAPIPIEGSAPQVVVIYEGAAGSARRCAASPGWPERARGDPAVAPRAVSRLRGCCPATPQDAPRRSIACRLICS